MDASHVDPVATPRPAGTPIAGVVLAGGRSRRMGRDKAALPMDGESMLARVVARISTRCDPISVVAADTSPAHRLSYTDELPVRWVTDEIRDGGPLAGLAAGLADAGGHGSELAFVCATDMPMVTDGLVDELLGAMRGGVDAVVAGDSDRIHPLAAVYRTGCAPSIAALVESGERRMVAALDTIVWRQVTISDRDWVTNVNAPEDLHRLRTERA